jgi:adenylate cyclase
MPEKQKVKRKLSAILSADVKGYSVLMADDEIHTIETLKSYRQIISDHVQDHSGRVVDSPGDNILAEFASIVDAVTSAVEIQKRLKEENKNVPEAKRLEFRIGVNIGDVVQDGDRIYGNGVNVAARIERLAEPGGICISRNAYDHISDKLTYGYQYLGEHEVKNIKKPVRVYKVLMATEDAGKLIGERQKRHRKKWPALAVATVAILVGIIAWQFYYEKSPPIEAASVENMAYPLPEKPSIVVLPFNNLSGNPEQDYIADGITSYLKINLDISD